jgi:hypothetical protein
MPMKIYNLFLFWFLIICFSCKRPQTKTEPEFNQPLKRMVTKKADSAVMKFFYFQNYLHTPVITIKGKNWICQPLPLRGKILLFNLDNNKDTLGIDMDTVLKNTRYIYFSRSREQFYFYKKKDGVLYTTAITGRHLAIQKTDTLPAQGFSEKFHSLSATGPIPIIKNQLSGLLINYQDKNSETVNYTDETPFLYYLNGKEFRTGHHPERFKREKVYYTGVHVDADDSGYIYYVPQMDDSIFRQRPDGNITDAAKLHQQPEFLKYKNANNTDLSYVRFFSETTEMNIFLALINNKYLIAVKQLKKEKVTQPSQYKYIVMDKNLHKLYADTLPPDVLPSSIGSFENKFFFFDGFCTKIYLYELE